MLIVLQCSIVVRSTHHNTQQIPLAKLRRQLRMIAMMNIPSRMQSPLLEDQPTCTSTRSGSTETSRTPSPIRSKVGKSTKPNRQRSCKRTKPKDLDLDPHGHGQGKGQTPLKINLILRKPDEALHRTRRTEPTRLGRRGTRLRFSLRDGKAFKVEIVA